MDAAKHPPAAWPAPVFLKLLPMVMLVAAVGATVFMAVAFGGPTALVVGGGMILMVLAFIVVLRVRGRRIRLALGVVLVATAIGMSVVFYIVSEHNPTAVMFGAVLTLSIAGLQVIGSRFEPKR